MSDGLNVAVADEEAGREVTFDLVDPHTLAWADAETGVRRTLRVTGHWLYARKSRRAQRCEGTDLYRPEAIREDCNELVVLAVGPDVGQRRRLRDTNPGAVRHHGLALRVGKRIMSLHAHGAWIRQSPLCGVDYFVDEQAVIAVLED